MGRGGNVWLRRGKGFHGPPPSPSSSTKRGEARGNVYFLMGRVRVADWRVAKFLDRKKKLSTKNG